MSNNNQRDFSVREEIRVALEENNIDLSIDDVLSEVEDDELMLDAVTLAVYEAISEKLKEQNKENANVEQEISQYGMYIVRTLMDRGLI